MLTPAKQTENQAAKPTATSSSFFGTGRNAPFFQAKLTVNQPGDEHEREADAVADKVMRMHQGDVPIIQRMPRTSVSSVMRAYTECEKEPAQRKATGNGDASGKATPPIVSDVLSSGRGQAMDSGTQQFMESRFGQDFSQVRIHSGPRAAESATAIQARAYTSGRDVVFGNGEYQPSTEHGQRLLAHELVHVGQQKTMGSSKVARFTDNVHHVVEDYAFENAGLSEVAVAEINQANTPERLSAVKTRYRLTDSQVATVQQAQLSGALSLNASQGASIHLGNTQRDYSQVGTAGNIPLLGIASDFGGYRAEEHFDNFIYEVSSQQWRNRQVDFEGNNQVSPVQTTSPIQYIVQQIYLLNRKWNMPNVSEREKLIHVGNAFHTVEDFFAHSNFVELMQGDNRHGRDLITADPSGPSDSEPTIMESIVAPELRGAYHAAAESARSRALPGTHTRMAKDHPGAHNFREARRLAALVIQTLTTDLLIALLSGDMQTRQSLLDETLLTKVRRYLRPPTPDDPWWEHLDDKSTASVDAGLDRVQARTPITVNQSIFSPLRSIEASAYSATRYMLGVASPVQVGDHRLWLQLGVLGVPAPQGSDRREDALRQGIILGGAQASIDF